MHKAINNKSSPHVCIEKVLHDSNQNQTEALRASKVLAAIIEPPNSASAGRNVIELVDQVNSTCNFHELEYTLTEIQDILTNLAAKNLIMYDKKIGTVLTHL